MMIDYWTSTAPDRAARIRRGAVVCALLASSPVFPQSAPPPDRVTVESPEPPAPILPQQPGFLDTLGRWLGDSRTKLDEGLKGTQDAIGGIGTAATGAAKDAAGAAQQATGAIIGLPGTRIVSGRERCSVAANGAPDCAGAASALCRAKGFESGSRLDIDSAQKCPAWVWWSSRRPIAGECKTETFVLRAVCQ